MHTFFVRPKAAKYYENIGMGNLIRDLLLTADNFITTSFDIFDRFPSHQQLLGAISGGAWIITKLGKKKFATHLQMFS